MCPQSYREDSPPSVLIRLAKWSMGLGGVLIVLGLASIVAPWVAAAAVAAFCGITLVVGGASQVAMTAGTFTWQGFWLTLVTGVLAIMLGVAMLLMPHEAAGALVIFLAIMLLLEASAKLSAAMLVGYEFPRGWLLFDGVVTAALGIILLVSEPAAKEVLLGIFVGINLLSSGITFAAAGWSLRSRLLGR
jgi:uncharacterized membrane protein HdeD (DUF308 family)